MNTKDFEEYYRSETNRRLTNIESDIKTLLHLRGQIIGASIASSSVVSIVVGIIIPLLRQKL